MNSLNVKGLMLLVLTLISGVFATQASAQYYYNDDRYYAPRYYQDDSYRDSNRVAGALVGIAAIVAADRYLDRKYRRHNRHHHYYYPNYSYGYRDYTPYRYRYGYRHDNYGYRNHNYRYDRHHRHHGRPRYDRRW